VDSASIRERNFLDRLVLVFDGEMNRELVAVRMERHALEQLCAVALVPPKASPIQWPVSQAMSASVAGGEFSPAVSFTVRRDPT
jgi:hypothetical protein